MLVLRSPAKVNLCLDIIGKAPNGYHEISTILRIAENYFDEISFETNEKDDFLSIIPGPQNPTPQRIDESAENFLNRAVCIMKNEAVSQKKLEKFARIIVHKNLPFSSGLGALSSNAATIMMGLNKLWELNLSKDRLKDLGAQLGMDVPFFFEGGICHCTHFGEIVEPINTNLQFEIEIELKSSQDLEKTKNAFAKLNLAQCGREIEKTMAFLKALKENDKVKALQFLHNDFAQLYPELESSGLDNFSSAPRRLLAGSGPSLFTAS